MYWSKGVTLFSTATLRTLSIAFISPLTQMNNGRSGSWSACMHAYYFQLTWPVRKSVGIPHSFKMDFSLPYSLASFALQNKELKCISTIRDLKLPHRTYQFHEKYTNRFNSPQYIKKCYREEDSTTNKSKEFNNIANILEGPSFPSRTPAPTSILVKFSPHSKAANKLFREIGIFHFTEWRKGLVAWYCIYQCISKKENFSLFAITTCSDHVNILQIYNVYI